MVHYILVYYMAINMDTLGLAYSVLIIKVTLDTLDLN